MIRLLKRVISIWLVVIMCISMPLSSLAETPGGGNSAQIVNYPGKGGGSSAGKNATYTDYGFRVTFTDSHQLNDSWTTLNGSYTNDDLAAQRSQVEEALKHVYIEPGDGGIYFYNGQFAVTPHWGVATSYKGKGLYIQDKRIKMHKKAQVTDQDNELAWMCYPGIEGFPRTDTTPYEEDLANLVSNAAKSYTSGNAFLSALEIVFMNKKGFTSAQQLLDYLGNKLADVISDGDFTADNLRKFSWDTDLYTDPNIPAAAKVEWSRTGYITMIIQFIWLAQLVGDTSSYEQGTSLIWNYINGGYTSDVMPLLEVEACQLIGLDGDNNGVSAKAQLITLPYTLDVAYDRDVVEWLYKGGWTGNMIPSLAEYLGTRAANAGPAGGLVEQGLGVKFKDGQANPANYPSYNPYSSRQYCRLLWPSEDKEASSGYLIAFTYAATGSSKLNNPSNAMGSFTWKLDPNGVHDVTPDEEVNASSTVKEINMSQAGYNKNNYSEWESYVNGYGNNNNKIRVTIYRRSDALEKDVQSPEFTRSQVMTTGETPPTRPNRIVTDGSDIQGVPVLGTVTSGQESRQLTNAELLEIIKTGTGLSYSETVVGSLEKGIRVTYAVRIEVKVGNKPWADFDNNQAEFVEYRSEPGVYSYQSDAPDGYAEIKCGYFDKNKYTEPFEAMAGAPTTENLYFASGGQEFVAQLKYEYVTNKDAIREFEQKYSSTQCEGYWTPSKKTFTDATIDEINAWMREHTDTPSRTGDFITESYCDDCGTVHHNGVGNEDIIHTSITGGITGTDQPTPGKYYTELSLHATHWDWHCDGGDDSHEEESGTDKEGNPEYKDVPCHADSGDVYDSTTQPSDETCDYDGSHSYSYYKVRATRYSGTIESYHVDYNEGTGHQNNQASIKWTQSYKNMNYAKIKEAHVWRLEQSRVEGIKQLTFKEDDFVLGKADEDDLADVIFNVAEDDNAKEGRMYYAINPTNVDYYVGNQTIETRGCCHCFNHNAAVDLLANDACNPTKKFETATCVSDYMILNGYRAKTSLLYYQYDTENKTIPILYIAHTDNPTDNGYYITGANGGTEWRGYNDRGKQFAAQDVTFNNVNPTKGTEQAVCANSKTFKGGGVSSGSLSWAGYNGKFDNTSVELAAGTDDPSEVGKYLGKRGRSNWSKGDSVIFKTGYTHNNQGEVNGFSTSSPQKQENFDNPFVLCVNNIDMDDFNVHNGTKSFHDSTIFYHNIISYGNAPKWEETEDLVYKEPGFHVDTEYYDGAGEINDINVHDPVSAQDAKIIPLPSDLDQRVFDFNLTDELNKETGVCPGKANACKYAHINCEYDGERFHTDACYINVRGQGLASIPVTGGQTTDTKGIYVPVKNSGSKAFGYTAGVQTFKAPTAGYYTFKLWGAEGGNHSRGVNDRNPGLGGYTEANVYLRKDETVYVYVGGKGGAPAGGWNGGGYGGPAAGGGGGATDIRVDGTSLNNRLLVAGGGGGDGCGADGGSGGGESGEDGKQLYGTVGKGGTQTAGGAGGTIYGTAGSFGQGGSNTVTTSAVKTGGGGGGGGWYGGGAGGNDYSRYNDSDDSGGGGGSGHLGGGTIDGKARVKDGTMRNGIRGGNGYVTVSWDLDDSYTYYVPVSSGSYTYDNQQATVIPMKYSPTIYTADQSGYFSVHLFGSVGGGQENGKESAGGLGGYAAGQIFLNKGDTILVTPGGIGSNAAKVGDALSGGYNGGGNGKGANGGGGATDVVKKYTHYNANQMNSQSSGGVIENGILSLAKPGAVYNGPNIPVVAGHTYRIDFVGNNLNEATFANTTGTIIHQLIAPTYAEFFVRANANGNLNIKITGNNKAKLTDVYAIDMADRLLVAGGGGGADKAGGSLNGSGDGRGGTGGGLSGENGYTNGVKHYLNAGAQASSGNDIGFGGDATANNAGGGGGGFYGGKAGHTSESGGGGGSSYLGNCQYSTTKDGQNNKAGYAVIVLPGMGNTDYTHSLSCNEPHHAPNSNWHRYTDGWVHDGGIVCTGITCTLCTKGVPITNPKGKRYEISDLEAHAYIVKHDGVYHLTYGNDDHCDECDTTIEKWDTYSLDGQNNQSCIWRATGYDAACYNTQGATNPNYHYAFGDEICYDACLDDNKHKVNSDLVANNDQPAAAGQFLILDHDFQVYFPDIGDFYGNGALALRKTQRPEGFGYVDRMITTPWIREKYVTFPFDVTYRDRTYLAGEHILLGYWDDGEKKWHDDNPDDFTYGFHCLLSNQEMASAEIGFTVIAINTPTPESTENTLENRNYTRYGSTYRAYHDASRNYFVDVVGRIGVLSMLDTGDFRFSNYYKQALNSWKVEEVVHNVDISKQNNVSVDQKTIFDEPISEATKGQNTWGMTDWLEPMDKLQPFPLTPGKNNVPALKNQAHRIGYSDYLSLVTIGNYYGENTKDSNNMYKVQIQPFYYHYNLKTKEWNPVDVYIKSGDSYKMINDYGTLDATTEYNFYYNLDWEAENKRRMYTAEEEEATRKVQDNWYTLWDEDSESQHINIPHGITYLHGTANMLFLRDGNRTFIGTRYREGVNTEVDNRIDDVNFNRQAQRWHFTLGLPSSAGFVKKDKAPTPANLKELDMENGVIVCALQIYSKGTVWTLKYDGVPAGERNFYLFDRNTTLISWEDAGDKGPEDKRVIAVYTDHKTSRNDLLTEGSH